MPDIVIASAARTPVGSFNGALASLSGAELMRGRIGESSVEGTDRGAGGAGDDDGSGHNVLQAVGGAWEAPPEFKGFSPAFPLDVSNRKSAVRPCRNVAFFLCCAA